MAAHHGTVVIEKQHSQPGPRAKWQSYGPSFRNKLYWTDGAYFKVRIVAWGNQSVSWKHQVWVFSLEHQDGQWYMEDASNLGLQISCTATGVLLSNNILGPSD